jgi:hypothetical protein
MLQQYSELRINVVITSWLVTIFKTFKFVVSSYAADELVSNAEGVGTISC